VRHSKQVIAGMQGLQVTTAMQVTGCLGACCEYSVLAELIVQRLLLDQCSRDTQPVLSPQ
jgi:hypothetical protein